ncbi:MAG: nuclear transport factor 2 family protein [Pseudomonadota bacterium]
MTNFYTLLKAAAFGTVLALASFTASFADGHSDVEKITEVLRNYESFVNDGDANGLGGLYTQDSILLPDRFDAFTGQENITGFYAFAFSALSLELLFTINADEIIVSGDTAYATTTSTGTRMIKETGQTVPEINRELWVFEKVGEDWKIARYAFNKSE